MVQQHALWGMQGVRAEPHQHYRQELLSEHGLRARRLCRIDDVQSCLAISTLWWTMVHER